MSEQQFCDKLADFLLKFPYHNDMIIHEDEHGNFGFGPAIGLCVSNRHVTPRDFDRARTKGYKVVCENTSFGIICYIVPWHSVTEADIPRLISCSGPPLYSRQRR